MNNTERFEYINTFNDFQRVAKYGTGVHLNGRILDADYKLLEQAKTARLGIKSVAVGDWVIMPNGNWLRVAHDWSDETHNRVQLCKDGQFSLNTYTGTMSMSGSLEPMIDCSKFKDTGKYHNGSCWFFSENYWGAHRGVNVILPCLIWETTEPLPKEYKGYEA